jgi:hypothetical protein
MGTGLIVNRRGESNAQTFAGNDYVTSIELFLVERTMRSCRRSTTPTLTVSADWKEPEMGRGSNLSRLGDFNQTVVFDAIRRTPGGISRVELVAETGLTAQTVSNIVRRLLAQELIVESGRVQSAVRGKPRTLLQVEPLSLIR